MHFDEEYFNSKEFQELLDSYEIGVEAGCQPFMDADDFVNIADYYNMVGDYDKAVHTVDYAIQLYPDATLPNVFKAREALLKKDYETARQYADKIASKDDPDYHYLVAEILIAKGHIAQADRYLRDYGLTVDSEEYQDFVKDCANLYIDYGISDRAYEWMMRGKPDDSDDFKELMARTFFGLGKFDESERLFNELLDNNPYSKRYWNALANTQFMKEDFTSAVTSSEYAIAIDPDDPEGLLSKANGLFRLNNYEDALNFYQRYEEIVPDNEFELLHHGICLVYLGRKQEAVSVLENALQIADEDSPYLIQIFQELAFCYSSLKKVEKALDILDRIGEEDCDHVDLLVVRGHILLENDRLEEAERSFREAIILSDTSPYVLLRIIVSLYDNHYVKACYQLFKKFFLVLETTGEEFNDGYSYMAICCYDMGNKDEFLYYLRKAIEHNPDEARLVLGFMFPYGTEVKDYYDYMYHKLNQ